MRTPVTKASGASRYFRGSITVYHNDMKKKLFEAAGKPIFARQLKEKGAVSKEVAVALAESIRRRMDSDFGMGVTGIAGPGGGSSKKPVGLIYIALSETGRTCSWRFEFLGDRNQVQTKAVKKALELLWGRLQT